MSIYSLKLKAIFALTVSAMLSFFSQSSAATLTWDANGATALQTDGAGAWLTANQWWNGSANVTWTSGDDAVFGNGGAGGAVTLASGTTVGSITFNSFTGTYTIGTAGSTITLNNGITMNSGAGVATIISPITLGAAQSWTNNDDSLLTVGTGAVTNGGFLLTIGGTGNTTVSSIIGGAGGLTKTGVGTLTLSGANTFTGGTTISAGLVSLSGANGVINASSGITLSGGRLFLDNTSNNNNRIANNVSLSLDGELSLSGNTAGTTESFGTLAIGSGSSTVTVKAATLASTLGGSAFSRTNNGTALIRGTALGQNVTVMGKVTLGDTSGLGTLIGTTTLNNALSTDSTKDVTIVPYLVGGTTDTDIGSTFVTYDTTLGFRALSTANQFNTALTAATNVRLTAATTTTSGSVAINSLIVASTNAAALTINDGQTLTVSSGAVLFPNTATIKPSSSTGILSFGSAEGVVTVNSGLTGTISAVVNGSGGLTKGGAGTLLLSATNGYTGTTTVNAGALVTAKAASLPGYNSSGSVVINGGTIGAQVGGSGWTTVEVDTLLSNAAKTSGALGIDTTNGSLTQWVNFNPTNLGALGLSKLGAGILTLDQANTYTGATTLSAGNLQLQDTLAIQSTSSMSMATGTTLELRKDTTGGTFTNTRLNPTGTVTINADRITTGSGQTLTLGGTVVYVNSASSQINFTGSNSYNVGLNAMYINSAANGNTFTLNPTTANATIGVIRVNTSSSNIDGWGAGARWNVSLILGGSAGTNNTITSITEVSGDATQLIITKNTAATWTVTGDVDVKVGNSHTVSAGTLNLGGTFKIDGGSRTFTVSGTGVLGYNNAGALRFTDSTTKLVMAGGSLDNTSGAAITTSTHNPGMTWSGDWTFIGTNGANSNLNLGTGVVTLGTPAGTTRTVTVTNSATTLTVGGVISNGTTATGLTKAGLGTLKLSGANTYTGATAVNAGTLQLDGSTHASSTANIGTAGMLTGTGTINGNATLTGGGIINKSSGTIAGTLGVTGGNWNGNGTVTGAVTSSSGIFTIGNGANLTASSGVSATGGAMVVNGTLTGTLTASSSTTISGTGTITGNTTISGIHSPGNSPGIQTYSTNLSYTNGSSVTWELAADTLSGRGTDFDGINVGGILDFTGPTTINLVFNSVGSTVDWQDTIWETSRTGTSGWLIYDVAGSTANFSNLTVNTTDWLDGTGGLFSTLNSGNNTFSLFQDGNDIYLNYNVIPEPKAALLGGLGLLLLLRRRREK